MRTRYVIAARFELLTLSVPVSPAIAVPTRVSITAAVVSITAAIAVIVAVSLPVTPAISRAAPQATS